MFPAFLIISWYQSTVSFQSTPPTLKNVFIYLLKYQQRYRFPVSALTLPFVRKYTKEKEKKCDQPDLSPVCLSQVFWTATSHIHIGTEYTGHNYEVCDHTLE